MEALRFNKTMFFMVIMMAMMWNIAKCELHYVGGSKQGWGAPSINLTQWSLNEDFHVGEWLYFGFDKHTFNVLEVNKTSYENCIDTGFIKNITRGGRDVFELKEVKNYYFISGRGFCWQGVKVAVHVTQNVAPAPQPTHPKKSGASALYSIQIYHTFVVLILILLCTNLFV